jgi:hypothetical protein
VTHPYRVITTRPAAARIRATGIAGKQGDRAMSAEDKAKGSIKQAFEKVKDAFTK